MASSPTAATTPTSGGGTLKKDKQGWMGTLTRGRRKAEKEVTELEEEGKHAIEDPTSANKNRTPDQYQLEEGQERLMVEPNSLDNYKVKELCDFLLDWLNDELAPQRIVVKNLSEDLYDGQILAAFIEQLSGVDLGELKGVTQSVGVQKQKLAQLIDEVNKLLNLPPEGDGRWTSELIHNKHLPAILHLLVALAKFYSCQYKLPDNVVINVVHVKKVDGVLRHTIVPEDITGDYSGDNARKAERDAFDTLFDHAPEKLNVVKKSLQGFVNKHLSKLNLEVANLDTQFQDGVFFVLLLGLLENYFVPLHLFHLTPHKHEEKIQNVQLALNLVEDAGLGKPKAKPEDIVERDLKATLRVLYAIFTKYKNIK